jgi:hypothetical protein
LKRRRYRTRYPKPKTWHHIGEDRTYMETTAHCRLAETTAEK